MQGQASHIVELLIHHELALKRLYARFSTMFPTQRDFWQSLAADEQSHAAWLEALGSDGITGAWGESHNQLKPQAIRTSIGYVESQITRAEAGAFPLCKALSIARDVERALLERQFSKLGKAAPTAMREVLLKLAEETEGHLRKVEEMLLVESGREGGIQYRSAPPERQRRILPSSPLVRCTRALS